jgi:hypothetical protein
MKALLNRLVGLIIDGPTCPACGHSVYIHLDRGCLALLGQWRADSEPDHSDGCDCVTPFGGSKRAERRTRRQMAPVS